MIFIKLIRKISVLGFCASLALAACAGPASGTISQTTPGAGAVATSAQGQPAVQSTASHPLNPPTNTAGAPSTVKQLNQPPLDPAGTAVTLPPNPTRHVPTTGMPGPYTTDPTTGGPHYPDPFPPAFYNESDLANLPPHPEGYLAHDLEHGYVIFWYNCAKATQGNCDQLKSQIKVVMDQYGGNKLIAFPWKTLDVPVVATSWGRMLRFPIFDPVVAAQYVKLNQNHSPEPSAP